MRDISCRLLTLPIFIIGISVGLELNLSPDELIMAQRQSSGGFYFYDSNGATVMFNRSLFVYREPMYQSWSNWSDCSATTCVEHRFRRCADDSYLQPVNHFSAESVCPFKFIAEERPCTDNSSCIFNARPSEELREMRKICGRRGNSSDDARNDEEEDEYHLKIVGGKPSQSNKWPWHVGIYKALNYNASEGLTRLRPEHIVCGGTLLTPNWVLTGAHCIKSIFGMHSIAFGDPMANQSNATNCAPISMMVRAGDTKLDGSRRRTEEESDHEVDRAIIHPNWVPQRVNSPYDVALVRLKTHVDIGLGKAGVACIPEKESPLPEDARCFSVGWGEAIKPRGHRRHRAYPVFSPFFSPFFTSTSRRFQHRTSQGPTLREIEVSVDPAEKCFHHDDENESQICAGNPKTGVCSGDTGGGLFCQNKEDGRWYVYGVMGSGPTRLCSERRWLYNSVADIAKWINYYAN